MIDTTLTDDLKKLSVTSFIFTTLAVVVLCLVFLSTVFLQFRVIALTHGLRESNTHIATQQVTLDRQQVSLANQQDDLRATQEADARANCETTNTTYATARALARAEAHVSVSQAISLYNRSTQTAAVNPPKNDQAKAARAISERFLHDLATDTYSLQLQTLATVYAKTKPLTC